MLEASRLGFTLSVTIHYLFPMITIGGFFWLMVQSFSDRVFQYKRDLYRLLFFVVVGITTGYVLKWHFSTYWPGYLGIVAEAFDPLLSLEAMLSIGGFILFTGLYVLGWKKKSKTLVRLSSIGFVITTLISSVIIVSVNSWMQYPSGVQLVQGPLGTRLEFDTLTEVFWSPSYPTRLAHTLIGALMLGITFQAVISKRWNSKPMIFLLVLWVAQFLIGHRHAAESYAFQPEKFAAFEGHGSTYSPADLWLFPGVNEKYNVRLSGMTSYLLYNDANHPVAGTDAWKEEFLTDKAEGVFQSYHLMVLAHFGVLGLLVLGLLLKKRKFKFVSALPWTIFALLLLANFSGWYTTEWGRQPWLIRGILKTSDALQNDAEIWPYTGVLYSILATIVPSAIFLGFKKRLLGA